MLEQAELSPQPEAGESQESPEFARVTPEEQRVLVAFRQEAQQLLVKLGEHEVLKARLLSRFDELEKQGQMQLKTISARLAIPEGKVWYVLHDGTIRLASESNPVQSMGQGEVPNTQG